MSVRQEWMSHVLVFDRERRSRRYDRRGGIPLAGDATISPSRSANPHPQRRGQAISISSGVADATLSMRASVPPSAGMRRAGVHSLPQTPDGPLRSRDRRHGQPCPDTPGAAVRDRPGDRSRKNARQRCGQAVDVCFYHPVVHHWLPLSSLRNALMPSHSDLQPLGRSDPLPALVRR